MTTSMRRWATPEFALGCGLVLATGLLITQVRKLYFFGDDWSFLLSRNLSWSGLVEPHNEHWSTLPVLAFRTMVHLFGINHYLAYAMMPIVLHLVCCVVLYLLMRRHDIPAWPSVLAVLMLAFLVGNLGENPLWDFQIGFLGSAALGLVALLLASGGEDLRLPRLAIVWVTTALSMMCSGMALPMLVWLGLYVWIERSLIKALAATVPPALYFLAWYIPYGRDGASAAPKASADLILAFAATGVSTVWEAALRVRGTGGVFFLLLLATALLGPLTSRERTLALSGLLASVISYLFLGISRAGLGTDAATASRYAYFAMLYSLPTFAIGLGLIGGRLTEDRALAKRWALVALTGFFIVSGVAQTQSFTTGRVTLTEGLRARVQATVSLINDHEKFLSGDLSPTYEPDLTVTALSRPSVQAELPHTKVTHRELLNASVSLQTGASTTSFQLPTAAVGFHDVSAPPKPGGCVKLKAGGSAYLDLPPVSTGSQLALTTNQTSLPVQLLSGRLVGDASTVTVTPKVKTYVGSTATDGTLRITLPAGNYRLCLP